MVPIFGPPCMVFLSAYITVIMVIIVIIIVIIILMDRIVLETSYASAGD